MQLGEKGQIFCRGKEKIELSCFFFFKMTFLPLKSAVPLCVFPSVLSHHVLQLALIWK